MPTAENAILYYEAGQDAAGITLLTDQGDNLDYKSADTLWSKRSGYSPVVTPNGLVTGGLVIPGVSGTENKVDVAALTCYLAGVLTSVGAGADTTVVRPAGSGDEFNKSSITITSAGAIAVVKGADHTAWSTTRGADGGPPWIPTTSIEIAQVWLNSSSAADITADEIKQVVGNSQERYDYPTWDVEAADVENGVLGYAGIKFHAALPEIHSDNAGSTTATKKVYADYYEPQFSQVPKAVDFVPAEASHSVTSKQIYGSTLAAAATSLGQGGFTAYLEDGITDPLLAFKNALLWFKFKPDRLKGPYLLVQGMLGLSRTFPAGDNIAATCTISAETQAVEVNG